MVNINKSTLVTPPHYLHLPGGDKNTYQNILEGGLAGKELSVSRPPRLLLQLHALTDNPMSLTITEDITVSAALEASIPTVNTVLLEIVDTYNTEYTITVPAGVTVLKVQGDVYHESPEFVELEISNVANKKSWLYLWDYEGASGVSYVGVTPGKSYTIHSSTASDTGTESGYVTLIYSQSINNQTPNVTDY